MPFERGDGFDFYSGATSGDFPLSALHTINSDAQSGIINAAVSLVAGRFGGQALRVSTTGTGLGGAFVHRPFETPRAALAHEFAFRRASYSLLTTGAAVPIYRLRAGVSIAFIIGVNFHGDLLFGTTNLTTNLIYQTSALGLAQNLWNTIGYEFVHDNAPNGRVLVRVDGEVIDEVTGIDTKILAVDNVDGYEYCSYSLAANSPVACDFDDAYTADTDELLPDVYKAEPLRPVLDAGPNQWTPSSGADHYAMVDDTTADGDATYISSDTPGNKDRFGLTDLSSNPREIPAMQSITVARKTDAGLTQERTNFVSGAAIAEGHTDTLSLGYGVAFDVITTDPDSETALDGFEVNAMQIEVEHLV